MHPPRPIVRPRSANFRAVTIDMGQRSWELTDRDREVLLKDEHALLRWITMFNYAMTATDMRNRLPRWPGRSLNALLEKGLVKRISCGVVTGTEDGYFPTEDGRRYVTVLEVMES